MSNRTWSSTEKDLLRARMDACFSERRITSVVGTFVTDLINDLDARSIIEADLNTLREDFVPPKALFTASWWCYEAEPDFLPVECLTISSVKRTKINSESLLQVVTIDSLGPPDSCSPLLFAYDRESGTFSVPKLGRSALI